MDENFVAMFGIVVLIASCFVLGALFGHADGRGKMRDQAIQRGYALYCPTDGDFAWKGECDD